MQDQPIPGTDLTPVDSDHLLPEHAGQGVLLASDDPHRVRSEIEQTRARMSRTIDELEEALVRKKERLEERLDVAAPVRERVRSAPLLYAGGVFAAALAAGYLSGDHDGAPAASPAEDRDEKPRGRGKKKSGRWEKRARELEETCERQDEEIRALRASLASAPPADLEAELEAAHGTPDAFYDRDEHDHEDVERAGGRSPALLGLVGAGLTAVVASAVARLLAGRSDEGGFEIEAELEEPAAAPTLRREVWQPPADTLAPDAELRVGADADGLGR